MVNKMTQIKVYPILGKHPIYADLFRCPPKDIEYVNNFFTGSPSDFNKLEAYSKKMMLYKSIYMKFCSFFKAPRFYYVNKSCDIIHSAGVCILNKKPWIVDAEHVVTFFNMEYGKILDRRYTLKLEKSLSNDSCKKIITFSNAAKNSFINALNCSKFEDKIQTIYPAIHPRTIKSEKNHFSEKIRILHSSNSFEWRGGKEILKAFDILNGQYKNIELVIVGGVPEKYILKYKKNKNIIFCNRRVPLKKLYEDYYCKSDIFVSLSFNDTFGFSYLEAMSTGLPVIGTDVFAIPEIIDDNKNGFIIKSPISMFGPDYLIAEPNDRVRNEMIQNRKAPELVEQLIEKLSSLIENEKLRINMGKASLEMVTSGKFSIEYRNKQLRDIYKTALDG